MECSTKLLIGITLEVLLQIILFAFLTPIIGIVIIYFLWLPRDAKSIIMGKATRKDINIKCNDIGRIEFNRGRVEGPGIFRGGKTENVSLFPRDSEPWINKVFVGDKIRYFFTYTGKAVTVNPGTLAVIDMNQRLQEEKLKLENRGKTELELYSSFIEKNPEAKLLLEKLSSNYANVEKEGNPKDGDKKGLVREVAILLDPRLLKNYITKAIGPAQILYVEKKAYLKGFEEGSSPFGKLKSLFLIIIVIAVVGLIAMLLLGGGGIKLG